MTVEWFVAIHALRLVSDTAADRSRGVRGSVCEGGGS